MQADDAVDVAIVGAGVLGASVAYWLRRLEPRLSIALIEHDRSFARASTSLSASSIRQQFSIPVNVRMSLFGVQFLRELGLDIEERGYLYLGPADVLRAQNRVQRANGADVVLLTPEQLKRRFPWLNVDDLELGSLGVSGEGWFDGQALHRELLRRQPGSIIEAQACGFEMEGGRVRAVRLSDGRMIRCGEVVNAAGPWARAVAAFAGIDLPVHARRRTVFVLSCPERLPSCPLVVDPSGFWFRPEGRYFIAGTAPSPDADDLALEPNYAEFDDALWARMAHRVPAFAALRVERAWAGYYEMNLVDHNAIIGRHPAVKNLWFANGFSGHGMQHAAAAGRGVAELIVHGRFATIDLSPLGFERLLAGRPLPEANVIG